MTIRGCKWRKSLSLRRETCGSETGVLEKITKVNGHVHHHITIGRRFLVFSEDGASASLGQRAKALASARLMLVGRLLPLLCQVKDKKNTMGRVRARSANCFFPRPPPSPRFESSLLTSFCPLLSLLCCFSKRLFCVCTSQPRKRGGFGSSSLRTLGSQPQLQRWSTGIFEKMPVRCWPQPDLQPKQRGDRNRVGKGGRRSGCRMSKRYVVMKKGSEEGGNHTRKSSCTWSTVEGSTF